MNLRDRRLQRRVKVRWPVSILTEIDTIQGETRDINTKGAFIQCQSSLPPNKSFLLNIKGPSGPTQVTAEVVWSNIRASDPDRVGPGMGVRFIWF